MSLRLSIRSLALVALVLTAPVKGAVLVSDFSSLSLQLLDPVSGMSGSWNNGIADQYTQNSGFVTIEPKSSGNPTGDGYFIAVFGTLAAPVTMDLTGLTQISLTARVDLNNASSVNISFYDADGVTVIASGTFLASSFTSTFSTQQTALIFTGNGSPASVTYWSVEGNLVPTDNFRYSLDNLSVAAVPEPATTGLLVIGALSIVCLVRRFRCIGA